VTRAGLALLALIAAIAAAAPWVTVHPPDLQHRGFVHAPPMPLRLVDSDGRWRRPFYYPVRLADPLLRTYEEDRARPIALRLAGGETGSAGDTREREPMASRNEGAAAGTPEMAPPEGHRGTTDTDTAAPMRARAATAPAAGRLIHDDPAAPWFPLGTDALGRDVWSRLVYGARLSLGVALGATLGALLLGTVAGALAAAGGRVLDEILMRTAELVFVLPILYVVLVLRASLPLVLPASTLFAALVAVLAVAGAPPVARGVRAILGAELARDYIMAARAAGAGRLRLVVRHALPATRPFLATQALVLAPAFVLAEATLSYVGLGFAAPAASWGGMLQEASTLRALGDFPWLLAPAVALVLVVFALTLASEPRAGRGLPARF
jgi:ABC-type dipeptide/oligopeptide/nickel transport system permease subunit